MRTKTFGVLLLSLLPFATNAATVTVHVFNFDFGMNPPIHGDPVIEVGDTVEWTWDGGVHSTKAAAGQADSWDSGIKASGVFDHVFNTAGVFNYYCAVHGSDAGNGNVTGMSGKVTVLNAFVPNAYKIVRGIYISGGVADTQTSDDSYLTVQKGPTPNANDAPIQVQFTTTSTVSHPSIFKISLEDGVNASGLSRRVELLNVQTNSLELVNLGSAQTSDKVNVFDLSGDLSRFVDPTNGNVVVKVSYFAAGPVTVSVWKARFDRVAVLAL